MSTCTELHRAIAAHLRAILARRGQRRRKEDGSFVTEGDLLCQSIVTDALRRTAPEYAILSEELPYAESCAGPIAVVDPIDGTENFTSGLPEWGVSVSLYRDGAHQESMLALPELGRVLVTGSAPPRHLSRIRGLSSSVTPEWLSTLPKGQEYRITGCAVYNLYSVIAGSFYSFENPHGAHNWDVLAGLNLALEHGLQVEVEGAPYRGEWLPPGRRYRIRVAQTDGEAL